MTWFDDLNGRFEGRLREIKAVTRTTSDGTGTITFRTARVEATYSPEVIQKLGAGQLLAIPNVQAVGNGNHFSVYEVADVYPMHYSMLTLDPTQPSAIRKEFMNLIDSEWKAGSKSTWIEIVAAPTGYTLAIASDNLTFTRRQLAPLTGAAVKLLSEAAVRGSTLHIC